MFFQLNRTVDYHVTLTKDFLNEENKFSLATPRHVASTYKRVWTVAPQCTTIAKDIKKVLVSFETVCRHKRIAVDGVGDRNGKRRIKNPSAWGIQTKDSKRRRL